VKSLSGTEKRMIVLALVLSGLLMVKSLWLDGYTPENASEAAVMNYCEAGEFLSRNPLAYERVVKLVPLDEEEINSHEGTLKFNYRIKVRDYLLGILPYSEKSHYIEE